MFAKSLLRGTAANTWRPELFLHRVDPGLVTGSSHVQVEEGLLYHPRKRNRSRSGTCWKATLVKAVNPSGSWEQVEGLSELVQGLHSDDLMCSFPL